MSFFEFFAPVCANFVENPIQKKEEHGVFEHADATLCKHTGSLKAMKNGVALTDFELAPKEAGA